MKRLKLALSVGAGLSRTLHFGMLRATVSAVSDLEESHTAAV